MNFLISCISASNRMPRNAFQPPDGSGRHKKIYPASGIYSADGPIDATSGRMARVSVFYRRHVMEQGRIIERGSHDELIAKKGKYYQLYTGNLAEN